MIRDPAAWLRAARAIRKIPPGDDPQVQFTERSGLVARACRWLYWAIVPYDWPVTRNLRSRLFDLSWKVERRTGCGGACKCRSRR